MKKRRRALKSNTVGFEKNTAGFESKQMAGLRSNKAGFERNPLHHSDRADRLKPNKTGFEIKHTVGFESSSTAGFEKIRQALGPFLFLMAQIQCCFKTSTAGF
ncbi:hypothetical protein M1B74_00140 [Bacteroides pyogenes]|uniref:hypothetical protein n=1 Tax=Bacteroides pyogenes TaxID=310300 RepID=UPI003B42EFF8